MATSIQCLKFSFYINVSFDDKKDPGVGANQNIYKEAQKNSPGYDMYNDGQRRDIFIKMNGSELQGQVNFQFVSNKVIKYSSKFWKISLPPPLSPQKKLLKNQNLIVQVWPGLTVFPDFTNLKNTTEFWKYWIRYFMQNETIHADGLWIVSQLSVLFVSLHCFDIFEYWI